MQKLAAFLLFIILLLTLTLFGFPQAATSKSTTNRFPAQQSGATAPNIIFILTDDMDKASLSSMPIVKEQLIDQGVSFSKFFISVPLCCPSRVSILRGQYAHNHGVLKNHPPDGGFVKAQENNLESSSIATWL